MKIAVNCETFPYPDSFSTRWIEHLKKRDVEVAILNFCNTDIIRQIRDCNGAMWHWFHIPNDKQAAPKIISAIEIGLGIPVFPNIRTGWHYDEKISQHYLLDAVDAPKIKSWVFWNYDDAYEFIKKCSYPIVFKLSVGAGSANVLKLESYAEAKKLIDKMFWQGFFPYTINEFASQQFSLNFTEIKKRALEAVRYFRFHEYPPINDYFLIQKNYVYFQEFLPDNHFDIRITVIGNRAFGFIRENRPGDFRASGSGRIEFDPSKIPVEAVQIAHKISKENKFQSMAYDFLYNPEGKLLINEISYCYASWAVHSCPGYWDRNLEWHAGNIWPEEAHVDDFIYYIEKGELP